MLSLLESKLGSLPPEITNNYPELIRISLNDINPELVKIQQYQNNINDQLQGIGNSVENLNQSRQNFKGFFYFLFF